MNYSRILLLAGLIALASCQPKTDSGLTTPADTSPPVATVNGTNISQNFFEQYIKAITGKAARPGAGQPDPCGSCRSTGGQGRHRKGARDRSTPRADAPECSAAGRGG